MKGLISIVWFVLLAGMGMAQDAYQIRPGDTLRIEVLEDPALNRSVLVLPDGRITFPFVGTVQAGGRTTTQIEQTISGGIAANFAAPPTVFVAVQALRPRDPVVAGAAAPGPTITIYFLGEVQGPGLKQVAPGTTMLQALAQNGGFTRFAAQKRIQLRRTDPKTGRQSVHTFDYRALADGAQLDRDIVLQAGDVILVPERRLFE